MTRIVAIDTETTSLRPERRAWEVGLIIRDPGYGTEREFHRFIRTEDLDLANADPFSLKIGGFYERHPQMRGLAGRVPGEAEVLAEVEKLTRDAHLVGAVPNFDAEALGTRMRAHGILPSWHYHLIDAKALAVGYLSAFNRAVHEVKGQAVEMPGGPLIQSGYRLDLPWNSDALLQALGITVSNEDRHTALGDAKWALAIYDAVTGGAPARS